MPTNAYTIVSGSGIIDAAGSLFNGLISFRPVDGSAVNGAPGTVIGGNPVVVTPSGASAMAGPFTAQVSAGVIQGGFQLPDCQTATSSGAAFDGFMEPVGGVPSDSKTTANFVYTVSLLDNGTRPILSMPFVGPTGPNWRWNSIFPFGGVAFGVGSPRLKGNVGAVWNQTDGGCPTRQPG